MFGQSYKRDNNKKEIKKESETESEWNHRNSITMPATTKKTKPQAKKGSNHPKGQQAPKPKAASGKGKKGQEVQDDDFQFQQFLQPYLQILGFVQNSQI